MIAPDYGYTAFGPIGGVFVLGVGMLVLGIPLMLACFAFGTKRFFRGETLNASHRSQSPRRLLNRKSRNRNASDRRLPCHPHR